MSMAPTKTARPRRSGSLFSGELLVTSGLEDFIASFPDILATAFQRVAEVAQRDLRRTASGNERWKDIANDLTVSYDGTGLVYGVSDDASALAHKLEYGDQSESPVPLIRRVVVRHEKMIGPMLSAALSREVPVA